MKRISKWIRDYLHRRQQRHFRCALTSEVLSETTLEDFMREAETGEMSPPEGYIESPLDWIRKPELSSWMKL